MRAVNLVPTSERKGARGAAGRSGGAAYGLLALLAILVLVVGASTMQKRSLSDKRAELTDLQAQAVAAESRAASLSAYPEFAALRIRREETVSSIAASRFDWSHALREFARVVPPNVWLTGLQGTVNPGVTLSDSAVSGTGTIRSAILSPAIEVVGCTTDQSSVAKMLTRVRLIDGVSRVTLQSSLKADAAAGGADASTSAGGDCRQGNARYPQFQFVVFLDAAAGAVPTQGSAAADRIEAALTPATGTTGPAPTGATP